MQMVMCKQRSWKLKDPFIFTWKYKVKHTSYTFCPIVCIIFGKSESEFASWFTKNLPCYEHKSVKYLISHSKESSSCIVITPLWTATKITFAPVKTGLTSTWKPVQIIIRITNITLVGRGRHLASEKKFVGEISLHPYTKQDLSNKDKRRCTRHTKTANRYHELQANYVYPYCNVSK